MTAPTCFFRYACLCVSLVLATQTWAIAAGLSAGAAKVDITDRTGPVNDPLFAKALVLKQGDTLAVLITLDVVATEEIGRIGKGFLPSVREALSKDLGIPPTSVIVNASHCHGIPRPDTTELTIQAVKQAWKNLAPVKVGVGSAQEARISENRRITMKDGTVVDMRRAYSMPTDEDIAAVGPIDPQVGLLRIDRADNGKPLAVLYNFACHPIMNPPGKGNSADYPGFASKLIEEALGNDAIAIFVQGCGGDINPIRYKEVSRPADAEPLGNMLGATVLEAFHQIPTKAERTLKVSNEVISVPRAADFQNRIAKVEAQQSKLLASLRPTNINFKAFLPLLIQEKMSPEYPSHYAQSYLRDKALGQEGALTQADNDNRASVAAYMKNIQIMEQLTRLNTNLALLKKHLKQTEEAGSKTLDVEVTGLRVGDFKLVTFPGELTVEIGLNLKKASKDPNAFVAGYTNGYIYYTATVPQRLNPGFAQEDCDVLVAPEWQNIFETKALRVFKSLAE